MILLGRKSSNVTYYIFIFQLNSSLICSAILSLYVNFVVSIALFIMIILFFLPNNHSPAPSLHAK